MPPDKIARVLGRRIHYVDAGKGESVILLHGLGGTRLSWSANVRALSAAAHVYALDQIGFGRSDKPDIEYTTGAFVEHLLGFMRELGIAKATLAGNSLGGEVALRLALGHPAMVERLILVASGGLEWKRNEEESAADPDPGTLDGMRAYLEALFFDRGLVTEDLVRLALDNRKAYGDGGTIHRYQAERTLDRYLEEAELGAIRVPVLIVWGRQDRLTPLSLGERLHAAIPGSRLVVFEECGHLPQVEKAAQFNKTVLGFLSGKE